ncbi:hypothetical protein ABJB81_000170 [Pseudomonas putida]
MEKLRWKRLETRPARQAGLGVDPTSKRVLMPGHAKFSVSAVAMELTRDAPGGHRWISSRETPVSRNNRSLPAIVLSPGVWQFIAEVGTATDTVEQSGQRLQTVLGIALASVDHHLRQSLDLLLDQASQSESRSSASVTQFQVTHITPETGPVFLHIRLPHEIGVDISSA